MTASQDPTNDLPKDSVNGFIEISTEDFPTQKHQTLHVVRVTTTMTISLMTRSIHFAFDDKILWRHKQVWDFLEHRTTSKSYEDFTGF